jgi:catechol 2,3-dioxygenase-like lactoylglutathione lyase family enzyme
MKGAAMTRANRPVKGLGEVSIRVRDLDAMQKFYEEVVGLEVLSREQSFVFFKIAEGYAGHSQNLALFAADNQGFLEPKLPEVRPETSSLHHIALNIALEDYRTEQSRLDGLGIKVVATQHEWLHVRSLYFPDPEENLLEFVCYDASVQ